MSRSRDIANLLGTESIILEGAPSALDTLNELAAAINDDASFASTITSSISSISGTISNDQLLVIGGAV
jgi:hypothetical protein